MPNGTRRGHTYTRNGRTFYRGPAKIQAPKGAFAVAVVGGGLLLAVGVPQVAIAGLAVAGVVAFFTARSPKARQAVRRRRQKVARKAEAWAKRRSVAAGRSKPEAPAKAPVRRTRMKAEPPRHPRATPAPPYRRPGAAT